LAGWLNAWRRLTGGTMADKNLQRHVVTCFIMHGGKILLLKRSLSVGSFRGYWAGVSGFLKTNPLRQAYTEIKEETGLSENDITLVNSGRTVSAWDEGYEWIVHPFLFELNSRKQITLDWENEEFCWVIPEKMADYKTVPMLIEALNQVLGRC